MKNKKNFVKTYFKGFIVCLIFIVVMYIISTYITNTTIYNNLMYAAIVSILVLFTEIGIGHTLEFLIGSDQDDKLQKIKDRSTK